MIRIINSRYRYKVYCEHCFNTFTCDLYDFKTNAYGKYIHCPVCAEKIPQDSPNVTKYYGQ